MKVRLKLFATYRRFLPPANQGKSCELEIPDGTRVDDVLTRFNVPVQEGVSVILVNGRDAAPGQILKDGDVIAVFPALAGG